MRVGASSFLLRSDESELVGANMKLNITLNVVWLFVLLLFLSVSVAQLSERLKNKTATYHLDQPHQSLMQQSAYSPIVRVNALLGGACLLLAAFWGFDVLLAWWMYVPS